MKRLLPLLLSGLILNGCASSRAEHAQKLLIGQDYETAESCLGVPAHPADRLPDGTQIAQWDETEKGNTTSIPLEALAVFPALLPLSLSSGSISISGEKSCNAIAHIVKGKIESFNYSGMSGGITGPNESCAPIVRACLKTLKDSKSSR
jgi:hypothetical protein